MAAHEPYIPGPASGARVIKAVDPNETDKWTLILVRELGHAPEKVWRALTEPEHLRAWAPFDADGNLGTVGASVRLTWVGTGNVSEARVLRADAPKLLEFGDIRWEMEPAGGGTRLTLWHKIDRRFISWGAAGWHICFDVLDRLLHGEAIGRLAGTDAMQLREWKRLTGEYASQFEGGERSSNSAQASPSDLNRRALPILIRRAAYVRPTKRSMNPMESTLQPSAAAQMRPKAKPILYWIVTALFCLEMSFTTLYELLPQGAQAFSRLGFSNHYFSIELSLAKFAGVAVLLIPWVPRRLKEWAYAGFAINLISAFLAHLSIRDTGAAFVPSTLTAALWAGSYYLWRLNE